MKCVPCFQRAKKTSFFTPGVSGNFTTLQKDLGSNPVPVKIQKSND